MFARIFEDLGLLAELRRDGIKRQIEPGTVQLTTLLGRCCLTVRRISTPSGPCFTGPRTRSYLSMNMRIVCWVVGTG